MSRFKHYLLNLSVTFLILFGASLVGFLAVFQRLMDRFDRRFRPRKVVGRGH